MKDDNPAIIFFILLGILICFLEVWTSYEDKPPIQRTEQIKTEDDSLLKQNELLSKQLENLQLSNDSLIRQLDQTKKRVTQLKKNQNEKIHRLDSLNGHELYDFFSKLKTSDSTLQQ